MPDDAGKLSAAALYEADYVAWAEAQAAALAAGRFDELDLVNLADEVGDLGKSEYYTCDSQVTNILLHLTKIEHIGPRQTVPHWRGEIAAFRGTLEKRITPTIRRRLRLALEKIRASVRHRLVLEELLRKSAAETAVGYTWEQIVDPEFFPEPRYA